MSAPWISEAAVIDWLVKSTVLIGLAWMAAFGARKLKVSAALRHLLWLSALAAAVTLPLLAALTPVRLAVLPAYYDPAIAASGGATAPTGWTLSDVLLATYACVAAVLLLRISAGHWRLNAIWRRALEVDSTQVQADALAASIGSRRCVAVRVVDHPSAPMTWGFVRPKILLPAAAIGWPLAERRLVLMHELAHVARADSFTQVLASVALAFAWFQPAMWFAAAYLRREQEHACDDRVLLAGASPAIYARTLLNVAAGRFACAAPAAVMMAAPSQLEARLKAIVVERPRMFSFSGGAITMLSACIALAAAAIAAPAPPARPVAQTPRTPPTAPVALASRVARAQLFGALGHPDTSAPTALVALATPAPMIAPTTRVRDTAPVASFATPIAAIAAPVALSAAPPVAAVAAAPLVAPTPPTPPTPVIAPMPPTSPASVTHSRPCRAARPQPP